MIMVAAFTASEDPAAGRVSSRSALGHCSSVTGHSTPSREGGALQSHESCVLEKTCFKISHTGSPGLSQLTFLHHRGLGRCGGVGVLNVAGEVGLPIGQVFVEQAANVSREEADLGAVPERCVLLLVRVGGVKEPLAVGVLAKWLRRLGGERIPAVHPKVVLVY